jgi:hypothetical protein
MRGINKIQNCYNLKEIYLDYIKDKNLGNPYYLSFKEYHDICEEYYKYMISQIIDKSKSIKLPFRMGYIYVGKKKPAILKGSQNIPMKYPLNSTSIDWKETKKLGKWVHHINDHTGGFKYRFIWSKIECLVVNREFYRLVLSRSNKRYLAKVIKSGDVDYLEIKK